MYPAESSWVVDDAILDPSISEDVDRDYSVFEDVGWSFDRNRDARMEQWCWKQKIKMFQCLLFE